MAEENNKPEKETRLAPTEKFQYNPEAVDAICSFNIKVDHLHWKLLCKQAQDLTTTPTHIWASILEHYLIKTGYLDPKAPSSEGIAVAVTIQELRDNPEKLFNFRPNSLLAEDKPPELKKPEGGAFDDDDLGDLNF